MARFTRGLVITLGFVLLGLFITIVPQKNASGQGNAQPVIVKNTPLPTTVTNTPLPVSGSLAATVSGNVNVDNFPATQNVTGTVGVNSLPAVSLNNSNTNPLFARDVDNPANEPFQAALCQGQGEAFTCFSGANLPSSFVVPMTTSDGRTVKELVIKFIDGACGVGPTQSNQIIDVTLVTTVTQNQVTGPQFLGQVIHYVPFSPNPSLSNNNIFQFATPTQIMANPNTNVLIQVDVAGTQFGCTMNLSGYLVTQ